MSSTADAAGRDPNRSARGRGRLQGDVARLVLARLIWTPFLILAVTFIVFVLMSLSPNDPARAELGLFASEEQRQQFLEEHGYDDPLLVRYFSFVADFVRFDLGDSALRPEPISELIGAAAPVTLQVMALAIAFAVVMSTVFGVLAAWMEGRVADRTISASIGVVQAVPEFWAALLFIQLFAVSLGVVPAGGYRPFSDGVGVWFERIVGPSLVLGLSIGALLTRYIRASVADELSKDYVRTAIGAGVGWPEVLARNVMRNGLIAPVTVLGLIIGSLISGTLIVEYVFNVPGMGTLLMSAVRGGDVAVVRSVVIIAASAFILMNLLVDIAALALNPRSAEAARR